MICNNLNTSNVKAFDYFGARYYASDLSVWLSVDPLSDMYPSTSPFMYVRGNPVMLVDPNGMFDDWFKDADGNYEWFDKPTGDFTDTETKKTWTHVGATDDDVLVDLGYPTEPVSDNSAEIHNSHAGNDEKSSSRSVDVVGMDATFSFSPNVSEKEDEKTDRNIKGKVFEGVNVHISFSHNSLSGETSPGISYEFEDVVFSYYKMYRSDYLETIIGNPNTTYFERSQTILKPSSLVSIKVSGTFWIDLGFEGKVPKGYTIPIFGFWIPNEYSLEFKRK